MEMTGLQIFKYLPAAKKLEHTNCTECGCQTCMAFALKLAKQNIEIEKCPHICDELKNLYSQSVKHAQKTICIGNLKIGGENVLYRHEKTFINPTTLAVVVDCAKSDYMSEIKRINDFEIKGVNKNLKVDLIILKNYSSAREMLDIKNQVELQIITLEEYNKLKILTYADKHFKQTRDYLINARTKAIKEKDDNFSNPICVWISKGEIFEICAKASFYICKYANMIIFEQFDEAMFSTIIRLRENIYTDPQKPLKVESKLYKFNEPNENSVVFLTTNFALTFFAVANELEGAKVPSYLVVTPSDGMSVLTAWAAEKFTPAIVSNTIKSLDLRQKVKTRKIIIPGLLSHMIEELQEAIPDFEFVKGTNEASDIKDFISNLQT